MRAERNHIDILTFIAVLTLMTLSVGIVYSASATWGLIKLRGSDWLLGSHALKVVLGFIVMLVMMQVDYHVYKRVSKILLFVMVILLAVTLKFGTGGEEKHATRWLRIAGVGIQPAEFAKYALIVHLAVLFAEKKELIRDFKAGFLPLMIWVAAVTGLVLLQPNFSNGAMIFGLSIVMLYIGRARLWHIGASIAALVPLLTLYMMSAEYRRIRIVNFFTGASSSGGTAQHQLLQGIIGFGNGGIFGVGPGASRQRDLFLPESYGDFVFSIIGEEYGLIGTLFILLLFLLIMARGMKIAKYARDEFGRYLALGITLSVTLYALVNAGVTLGILPTTGLPMPFMSYGGSSMLVSAAAIGVLLNISAQTDLRPRLAPGAGSIRPLQPSQTPAVGKVY